jgi:hypothetical protein
MIASANDLEEGQAEKGITGEIYKFFELDPKAAWYNVVRKKAADPEEKAKIQIPSDLKPHLSVFYYVFFPTGHRLFFECKYGQHRISPGSVAKMLEKIFERPNILREFGPVEVTIEPSTESLARIFKMPLLRHLRIELTRPNADTLGSARRKVMERLENMNAQSQTIEFRAERGEGLEPDEEARTLAGVAQSNGHVEATGQTSDGKPAYESTKEHPLKETVTYDPQVEGHRETLVDKAKEILRRILNREGGAGGA